MARNKKTHESFNLRTIEDLREKIRQLDVDLWVSKNIDCLFQKVECGKFTLPNRFVVLPMEGCDGKSDGSPDELTFRRYRRFAAGGAGVLWFEATAVVPEARANPRQLWLNKNSLYGFKQLVDETLKTAKQTFGEKHRPLLVVQLTHSGRYSKPGRKPSPIIAHHSVYLDPTHNLPSDYPLITDEELMRLEDAYVEAAVLAYKAGFDAVDIKACHRYLISELHASHIRENSIYGGAFENRVRFFKNIIKKIRSAVPKLIVTSRMNAYDAMPYPYGFGMKTDGSMEPDLSEPIELVKFLMENGAPLVNITIGNPYYNPHINRPFDKPTIGAPVPKEHPLIGVERFIHIVKQIQQTFPKLLVVGGGYSWLRHLFPYVAAASVEKGWASLIGIGRMAFAYPDCVRDLKEFGLMFKEKSCIACSACTQIMRDGGKTGCVPRDYKVYSQIYKKCREDATDTIIQLANQCRQCEPPLCAENCPAGVNIPKFISQIAERQFRDAYETLRTSNILSTICGYVCPAEVQCEKGCLNQHFNQSISIRRLQKWVSKMALDEGWTREPRKIPISTDKKVAVIGAGPAGIAAAAKLAEAGHRVTIYEKENPGGLVESVIPEMRVPSDILRTEIKDVLNSYNGLIEIQHGSLGKNLNIKKLFKSGFHAIIIASGLQESLTLQNGPRPEKGVVGALEFLRRVKHGEKCSGTILVIGGGNTALDAACCAKLAGAKDVFIVYRRSFKEMPAWHESIHFAFELGVNILTNIMPVSYDIDNKGVAKGLKVVFTLPGETDASGRRKPIPLPQTEHTLPGDLFVEAIGQKIDSQTHSALEDLKFTENGLLWVDKSTFQTSCPNVFAAGDIINGGGTVVQAVADGVKVAENINKMFQQNQVAVPISKTK
ncbi:MAG: FAD-dependent oxidoreductase [Verrucomicrobiae bacterium]|nr:FAD-dependent oxidoreductase [Verrucomicrobiae bacterium]